jgi:hypothetical protein
VKNKLNNNLSSKYEGEALPSLLAMLSKDIIETNNKWVTDAAMSGWTLGLTMPQPQFKEIAGSSCKGEMESILLQYYTDEKLLTVKEDIKKRSVSLPEFLSLLIASMPLKKIDIKFALSACLLL